MVLSAARSDHGSSAAEACGETFAAKVERTNERKKGAGKLRQKFMETPVDWLALAAKAWIHPKGGKDRPYHFSDCGLPSTTGNAAQRDSSPDQDLA